MSVEGAFYDSADLTVGIDTYMSGNGVPYIAQWTDVNTPPDEDDFVPMGQATDFSFTPKITKKNHKSHTTGVQAIDDRVSVYQEGELKITLSNWIVQNLTNYFQAVITGTSSNATGDIMQAEDSLFWIRFDQVLRRGYPRRFDFYKCDVMPAEALKLIADGEGEGDWGNLALTVFMLKDKTLGWGKFGPIPTT